MALLKYFGLPISPDETINAQKTYQYLGIKKKDQLQAGLRSVIVKRRVDLIIFNEAFELYFNKPDYSKEESYYKGLNRQSKSDIRTKDISNRSYINLRNHIEKWLK